jgi:DNA-directed RNA polymerase omega subunit
MRNGETALFMAQETAETLENEENDEVIDPPEIDSKYRMILLAAQRSKQLQRGAISRTDIDTRKHNATRVAMREIEEEKVNFKILEN